eukprot:TRINITY_DN27098_c0_g1_i1.p1 TRINITY_DN27098_c0_g1~~TRINITY_DN27098_c0_g1_i1.p1  ORF type:complete len:136 (-),score=28.13 TRINITY_DN27098_c0_g1_i1:132-539(-)
MASNVFGSSLTRFGRSASARLWTAPSRCASSAVPDNTEQWLLTAKDYTDADTLKRRMAVRETHLARARTAKANGSLVLGGAVLDEQGGKMVGSMMVFKMNRADLDKFLKDEVYITGKVWESYEIKPFRAANLSSL